MPPLVQATSCAVANGRTRARAQRSVARPFAREMPAGSMHLCASARRKMVWGGGERNAKVVHLRPMRRNGQVELSPQRGLHPVSRTFREDEQGGIATRGALEEVLQLRRKAHLLR